MPCFRNRSQNKLNNKCSYFLVQDRSLFRFFSAHFVVSAESAFVLFMALSKTLDANVPKIEPGDFSELVKVLDKFVTDGNINVSAAAVTALGYLAGGLGKGFGSYVKVCTHTAGVKLRSGAENACRRC